MTTPLPLRKLSKAIEIELPWVRENGPRGPSVIIGFALSGFGFLPDPTLNPGKASLTAFAAKLSLVPVNGGRSSAWLEPQIVDLAVAGSNPVDHPISYCPLYTVPDFGHRDGS